MKKFNIVIILILLLSIFTFVSAETHLDELFIRTDEIRPDTSSYVNISSNVSMSDYLNVTRGIFTKFTEYNNALTNTYPWRMGVVDGQSALKIYNEAYPDDGDELLKLDYDTWDATFYDDIYSKTGDIASLTGDVYGEQVYEDYGNQFVSDGFLDENTWVRIAQVNTSILCSNTNKHALFTLLAHGDYTHGGNHTGDELYARQNQHVVFWANANRNTPEGVSINIVSSSVEDSQNRTTYPQIDKLRIVIENSTESYGRPISNPEAYLEMYVRNTDEDNYKLFLRNSDCWEILDPPWETSEPLAINLTSAVEVSVINNWAIGGYFGDTYIDHNGTFVSEGNASIESDLVVSGTITTNANTTATTCNVANAGAIYYNGDLFKHYGCNSTSWNALY